MPSVASMLHEMGPRLKISARIACGSFSIRLMSRQGINGEGKL